MRNNDQLIEKVTCFGEILWDVLPTAAKPGGAPMNVAYHLHRLGVEAHVISRIGDDDRGEALKNILQNWGLSTASLQVDSKHATSEVIALMDESNEMTYEILEPVAWDFIEWNNTFNDTLTSSDALVYGSLASRNSITYNTLLSLLENDVYKVMDVNLRPPHYREATIKTLVQHADLLKLNEAELDILSGWSHSGLYGEEEKMRSVQEYYNVTEIILTKGSRGASYYNRGMVYNSKTFRVEVADTVGSGDAFLAAFLSKKNVLPIQEQLNFASALGAFVASQQGACPPYSVHQLNEFINGYDR